MTTGRRVTIPRGYRIDKAGKLVPCVKHLDVSRRLQKQSSKKMRVTRRTTPR